MARIRTIKPEFWEDEVIGLLSREARLLFIATFNLADDEGLLRWTAPYIKASAFMYDDDLTVADISKYMSQVADAGLVFPYIGGIARQQMAVVVNFRKHQRINRPQPGKLPAPSLQNRMVREMYARRDGWACQLCGGDIPQRPHQNDSFNLSIDHKVPQSQGGSDYPSNLRATHQGCNKGRRDREDEDFTPPRSVDGLPNSVNDSLKGSDSASGTYSNERESSADPIYTDSDIYSLNDSVHESVSNTRPSSLPEGKGREGKGKEGDNDTLPPGALREDPPSQVEPAAADKPRGATIIPIRIDVEQACTLLADLIEANGSRRPAITQHWRDECRRMLDRDGIPLEDVLGAIRWSQADSFWCSNVLSMPKLRKQYDTLRLQAQRGRGTALASTGTDGHQLSTADRRVHDAAQLAARLAAEEHQ